MLRKHFLFLFSVCFLVFGSLAFLSLRGRPRSLPPAHAPLNELEIPVVSRFAEKPQELPIEKISLWLKNDGLLVDKRGVFSGWRDSGPNQLELRSSSRAGPSIVRSAIGNFAALRFKKGISIESGAVAGEKLFKDDSFAVYILFKPLGHMVEGQISDLFGWGDCGTHRMLSHLMANDRLEFQYGDPEYRTQSMLIANLINQYNLAVFTSSPKVLSIELNGRLISSRKNIGGFSAKGRTGALKVGNSFCDNGFDGEVAEFVIVSGVTAQEEIDAVTQFLVKKHSLEF